MPAANLPSTPQNAPKFFPSRAPPLKFINRKVYFHFHPISWRGDRQVVVLVISSHKYLDLPSQRCIHRSYAHTAYVICTYHIYSYRAYGTVSRVRISRVLPPGHAHTHQKRRDCSETEQSLLPAVGFHLPPFQQIRTALRAVTLPALDDLPAIGTSFHFFSSFHLVSTI